MCETYDHAPEHENLSDKDQRCRDLNDRFRQTFEGGQIVLTQGFRALPNAIVIRAFQAIQSFDAFYEGNDPYGTREFGSVQISDHVIWFKIDAFDQNLEYGSLDPSDPAVTKRVMTILLPNEY